MKESIPWQHRRWYRNEHENMTSRQFLRTNTHTLSPSLASWAAIGIVFLWVFTGIYVACHMWRCERQMIFLNLVGSFVVREIKRTHKIRLTYLVHVSEVSYLLSKWADMAQNDWSAPFHGVWESKRTEQSFVTHTQSSVHIATEIHLYSLWSQCMWYKLFQHCVNCHIVRSLYWPVPPRCAFC